MHRVQLQYAKQTMSPRVYRQKKTDFCLNAKNQVLVSVAERKIGSAHCIENNKSAIGINFGESNPFNLSLPITSVMNKDFAKKVPYQYPYFSVRVSPLMHLAALRYILTVCRYLGIPKVAIATERFSLSELVEKFNENNQCHEDLALKPITAKTEKMLLEKAQYIPFLLWAYHIKDFYNYPLYEIINLINLMDDLEVEIVQTGIVDQEALALATENKRKTALHIELDPFDDFEPRKSGALISHVMKKLSTKEMSILEARQYITEHSPRVWDKCIYADYNHQLLTGL